MSCTGMDPSPFADLSYKEAKYLEVPLQALILLHPVDHSFAYWSQLVVDMKLNSL